MTLIASGMPAVSPVRAFSGGAGANGSTNGSAGRNGSAGETRPAAIVPLLHLDRTQPQVQTRSNSNGRLRFGVDLIILDFYCEYPGCTASAAVQIGLSQEKSALPKGWSYLRVWTPAMEEPLEFELCKDHTSAAIQPWMLEEPPQGIGRMAEQLDVQSVAPQHEEEPEPEDESDGGYGGGYDLTYDIGNVHVLSQPKGAYLGAEALAALGADEGEETIGDPDVAAEPLIAFFGEDEEDEEATDPI